VVFSPRRKGRGEVTPPPFYQSAIISPTNDMVKLITSKYSPQRAISEETNSIPPNSNAIEGTNNVTDIQAKMSVTLFLEFFLIIIFFLG